MILYKQFRNLPIRKSARYLKWLKRRFPDKDAHHILGSMTGIKLNDYLIAMVTREEHIKAEQNKAGFFEDNLPKALNNLFEYVNEIESRP